MAWGWVRVPLISRASTFYSLRQSWLPLFGCQYKSGGSGVIVSSGERTEQNGCTEQKGRESDCSFATELIVDHLTWEFHRQGSAPKCHGTPMKTLLLLCS